MSAKLSLRDFSATKVLFSSRRISSQHRSFNANIHKSEIFLCPHKCALQSAAPVQKLTGLCYQNENVHTPWVCFREPLIQSWQVSIITTSDVRLSVSRHFSLSISTRGFFERDIPSLVTMQWLRYVLLTTCEVLLFTIWGYQSPRPPKEMSHGNFRVEFVSQKRFYFAQK